VPVGRVLSINEKSKYRRTPDCKYSGECGGCDWLFIDPQYQCECKKNIFIDCLTRIGKIRTIPQIDMFTSPETAYRQRAQLKGDGHGTFGFYKKKTNEVVQIDTCPLLTGKCNDLLAAIQEKKNYTDKPVIKIIGGNSTVASDPVLRGVTLPETDLTVGQFTFRVHGGSFFQSNRFLAEVMGTWASPYISGDFCVDLYGGTGFFSVMLNRMFKKGILIESIKSQVEMAELNFRNNNCTHFSAVCCDAERMRNVVKGKPDVLIVDPPRPGLTKDVRKSILAAAPEQLLYISCNPSTQARDVNVLVNNGYEITHAALFDCYPNTYHIESGLLLRKK